MRGLRLILAAVLLAGCATGAGATSAPRTAPEDPLYALEMVDPDGPAASFPVPDPGKPFAYRIEVRLAHRGRGLLQAPVLTVLPRQRGFVSVTNRFSFVQSFEAETDGRDAIANPLIGTVTEGVFLEVAAIPVEGRADRVLLACHASVSDLRQPFRLQRMALVRGRPAVTIQLPTTETSEAEAVRLLVPGVTGLLGVLPSPEGGDPVELFARVVPVAIPEGGEEALPVDPPAGSESRPAAGTLVARLIEAGVPAGPPGRLSLSAVVLRDAFPPSTILDAGATEQVLRDGGARTLRSLGLVTSLEPGVRMESRLEEAFVQDFDILDARAGVLRGPVIGTQRSGLRAAVGAGGDLEVSWTTSPAWGVHDAEVAGVPVRIDLPECRILSATLPVVPGRRLVSLGRTRDGGTAAVLVDFRPEGEPTPEGRSPGAPSGAVPEPR